MLGAIIGDIAGSRFQWDNHKSKDFELLEPQCYLTDDSIMTMAVAKAILESRPDYGDLSKNTVKCMRELGRAYPDCEYGNRFYRWLHSPIPMPYHSFGNGAAMRVSPVGFAAKSSDEAKLMALKVTKVTHNHPEGIKAAEAVSLAIFMARQGNSLQEIREVICRDYYPINFTLDQIRPDYDFDVTCQGSVPQAFESFFESVSFEDAIRNAISIGGDSDTIAAICGGIAEAYYGIPYDILERALFFIDERQVKILLDFERRYQLVE